MKVFTHLLFLASYATLAIFVALLVPEKAPVLGLGGAVATGGLIFLAAALLHEMASRKSGHQGLASAIMTVHHAGSTTADDLEAARIEIRRLKLELAETGNLTKQRIDTEMAAVKRLLGQLADRLVEGKAQHGADRLQDQSQAASFVRPASRPATTAKPAVPPPAAMADDQVLVLVREALEQNRFDLYLQPVVTLPQRKTRFFEVYSRLRDREGKIILPDHYVATATRAGLITSIDSLMLFRCVQIIRKLRQRNRSRGFFCNMSLDTLRDEVFFDQFAELLRSDRTLPDNLIFEVSANELESADPEIGKRFADLANLGFSFSLDQVSNMDINCEGLAKRNFRYVKVDARKLAGEDREAEAAQTISRLRSSLRQNSIDLIAEKIETERMVVDLLEYGFDYGEGYLFGEPRPVREDF